MTKKELITACVLCGALMTAGTASADDDSYVSGFGTRLGQGIANTATGFIELPKNVINITNDSNIFVGLTWGVLRGALESVARTVVGAVEIVASPIPTGPLITPPYVWTRFSEDTRYFGAHMPGYWTSYGPLDDGGY